MREPLSSRLAEVRDVLMFSFDFELLAEPLDAEAYATPHPWVPAFVVPGASTTIVGRDAMGGVYACCELAEAPASYCFHLDTRGHVVPLGEDLEHALALLVALPYWHAMLLECASGDLECLRETAARLEQEVCDELPDLPRAREYLRSFLQLPDVTDPVRRLHELASAHSDRLTILSPHGWRYESPLARFRASTLRDELVGASAQSATS